MVSQKAKIGLFVGFNPWKELLPKWFRDHQCIVVRRQPAALIRSGWLQKLLVKRNVEVFVWGMKYPSWLKWYCRFLGVPFYHIEDGFVRSIGLGSSKAPPASLLVDAGGVHYDCGRRTDLERRLATYDFRVHAELMERAEACIDFLLTSRVSKYNVRGGEGGISIRGDEKGRRILVVGQVESDLSLKFGKAKPSTNKDLIRLAVEENPGATVLYKPHPAFQDGADAGVILGVDAILPAQLSPADALTAIDHVYTMTSLMGFEALLRGIPVTCVGMPFYAGWGLTDDRQICRRRARRLTLQEVFAGAYLLQARYFDPYSGRPSELEQVISHFSTAVTD